MMPRILRNDVRFALLAAALVTLSPAPAPAQGIFDFLFGQPPQRSVPPPIEPRYVPSQPAPSPRQSGSAAPGSVDLPISNSGTGRGSAYCVRTCDGRYFPIERHATASPAQICGLLCPSSPTKVYSGGEISRAVAADGTRYGDLKTAYLYRKTIVPDCSCNGRNSFGLTAIDVKIDPTFRPGDSVARADGVIAVGRP
jgi:hypothetical protein